MDDLVKCTKINIKRYVLYVSKYFSSKNKIKQMDRGVCEYQKEGLPK